MIPARPPGKPEPGLHLVATPIGNAEDITLRALRVLATADVLVAEDTRRLRTLLGLHGLAPGDRPLLPYHDHNGPAQRPAILGHLRAGLSVALVSDAGTPLVADPGYRLVVEAAAEGLAVHAVPGPSALLAALSLAALPTDRFGFFGFPPARAEARRAFLARIANLPLTLVLYESPRRIHDTLGDIAGLVGPERRVALCRELTKTYEETIRGPVAEVAARLAETPVRGEIVLVIAPAPEAAPAPDEIEALLRRSLATLSMKDAVAAVAAATGAPRRDVYARALRLADGSAT